MIIECILEGGSIDFAWILNGFQYISNWFWKEFEWLLTPGPVSPV